MIYYTVFAGINGAGKSLLYKNLADIERDTLGIRLNIDERAAEYGSWRDAALQIKCAKEILNEINVCIKNKISFNQETTLSGMTAVRKIIQAKEQGFFIRLYYVFISTPEKAVKRIEERVSKGGHGIDAEIVKARFPESLKYLKTVIPYCNQAYIYDNTEMFKLSAKIENGVTIYKSADIEPILQEYI